MSPQSICSTILAFPVLFPTISTSGKREPPGRTFSLQILKRYYSMDMIMVSAQRL